MTFAPANRLRTLNGSPVRPDGKFVLYWMVAQRRTRFNFALQQAVARARELSKPLVVLEALRHDYPFAGERLHRFVTDGMADNAERLKRAGVAYYPYVEPEPSAAKGLIEELGHQASLIVTDDYPAFMLPRLIEAGAWRSRVAMEAVDSNGLLPLRSTGRVYPTAHSFRRFLQKELHAHLQAFPAADPLARVRLPTARIPGAITRRWPRSMRIPATIDRSVGYTGKAGGTIAARAALRRFLTRIDRYTEDRNQPDRDATSGLSPYLHFGHISAHEICRKVLDREDWTPDRLATTSSGSRTGWWGLSESAEAFLDQLVTWRELGFNMCSLRDDYVLYGSLPAWAVDTLEHHAADRRSHVYTLEQFEAASTHDPLWNATQRQLVREGSIHNYLRMLWGKKILDWSESPEAALEIMLQLNDKYAIDGRDPNSYSGIFWVLGRYDRAWGPERPVFGKVRYMASANTARKLKLAGYLERYGA